MEAHRFLRAFAFGLCSAVIAALPLAASAADPGTPANGSVAGRVVDSEGKPVSRAQVVLSGKTTRAGATNDSGGFTFTDVPPGIYAVSVSRPGLTAVTLDDVAVLAAQPVTLTVRMQPASFSSLQTIGHVVATRTGSINASTAAVSTVTPAEILDQGQTQVSRIVDEIPGIIDSPVSYSGSSGWNTADPWVAVEPQIRGALPYETATLIDGHPVQVGANGSYNISFLSAYLLQDVEVVKGPGAMVPNIDYAIGGTINFRTLEPTAARHFSFDYGVDGYGGQISNFRATGTTLNGKLGYAVDYALDGSPGPFHNSFATMPYISGDGGQAINGVPTCTAGGANCPYTFLPGLPGYQASYKIVSGLVGTADAMNSDHFLRGELIKLRANISQQTSLTVSFLGGEASVNDLGQFAYSDNSTFFAPPAGYAGSIPAGAVNTCCENVTSPGYTYDNQGIFQAELRTTFGTNTILARYYEASLYDLNTQSPTGAPGDKALIMQLYGGVNYANPAATQIFNGQTANLIFYDNYISTLLHDRLGGYSVELDHPAGPNLYTLSLDQTRSTSYEQYVAPPPPFTPQYLVPAGSGQDFRTISARAALSLTPQLNATISDYLIAYTSRYSPLANGNFTSSSHDFDGPRAGLTWRPSHDVSWRFSTGASIAPPYVTLLTTPGGPPVGNLGLTQNTYYTQTVNSGAIQPETAWGYDLGADRRFSNGLIASGDVYETTLHGQYLNTVALDGTYNGVPLYLQQTANLGHSRYEGVELTLHRSPAYGVGFRAQGALLRAFAYDLPAGFYDSAAGPNTINLGILPNENFVPSGLGYNGLSASRVPYSQGYGELNYRARHGAFYRVGVTYIGPNNGYNEPAFGVMSASVRFPLGLRTSLLLSGDNLTGAYDKPYIGIYSGMGVPLADGLLGQTVSGQYGPATFRLVLHRDL